MEEKKFVQLKKDEYGVKEIIKKELAKIELQAFYLGSGIRFY